MALKKILAWINPTKSILLVGLLAGILTGILIVNLTGDSSAGYKIGDLVQLDGYQIRLNGRRVERIEEPNSGTILEYVVVDVSITNDSQGDLAFIPVFQTFIRTDQGVGYDMSPLPGIQPIYAGDITAGTTVSGELSYFVPNAEQNLTFFFDPGWNQQPAVFIEL
jgi:hypothetical protein